MTTYSPGLGTSSSGSSVVIQGPGGEQATVTGGKLDVNAAVSTTGLATDANQVLLNSLIETLNELNTRLTVLAGMANSGAPALRVAPISSVSTAVTGAVTVASTSITNFGTGIPASEMAHDMNNMTAVLSNINNVTA